MNEEKKKVDEEWKRRAQQERALDQENFGSVPAP